MMHHVLQKNTAITGNWKDLCNLPSQPTGSMNAIIQLAQTLSKAPNTALLWTSIQKPVNKPNHLLRRVAHSTTFMSPELYMRSLTLFLADLNFCVNKKKKKVIIIFLPLWFNILALEKVTKFRDSLSFSQNLSLYFSLNFVIIALFISFCHKICR